MFKAIVLACAVNSTGASLPNQCVQYVDQLGPYTTVEACANRARRISRDAFKYTKRYVGKSYECIPLANGELQNMIESSFRTFCLNKWFDHKDEIYAWTNKLVLYDDKYYFNKHRWMLKRMFKEQNNEN